MYSICYSTMESVNEFVKDFLEEYGVDFERFKNNSVVLESRRLAEEGAARFVQQGGHFSSKEEVTGMILDGLRYAELSRLELKAKETYKEISALRQEITLLFAVAKIQRKVKLHRKLDEIVLKLEEGEESINKMSPENKLLVHEKIKFVRKKIEGM